MDYRRKNPRGLDARANFVVLSDERKILTGSFEVYNVELLIGFKITYVVF